MFCFIILFFHFIIANPEIVSILLRYGADVSTHDFKGRSALFYTLSSSNTNKEGILSMLLQNQGLVDKDNQLNRFLHEAIKSNKTGILMLNIITTI